MKNNENISFLPFHAINEFMRDDYREKVNELVFNSYLSLDDNIQRSINNHMNKVVKIPGFRNSSKAPHHVKRNYFIKAFEKSPGFVATILNAWAGVHEDLQLRVYSFLLQRGWDILPLDADRTKLPGFITVWPDTDDFEQLYNSFSQENQDFNANSDDVSLMIVWISGRLPFSTTDNKNIVT